MFSITITIIIITCLFSFAAFNNNKLYEDMLFWPGQMQERKQYYRFLTYGLIHADLMHLAFNMYTLYSFGERVEKYSFSLYETFGGEAKIFYLILYVSALVVSTIPDYFKNRNNFTYRAVGASGAVSAVLFAGIMLEPKIGLYMFFIPIRIPGYVFGFIFLALSAYLAKKGNSNIGHGAHFTGAVYGLLFTIIATKLYSGFDAVSIFFRAIMSR